MDVKEIITLLSQTKDIEYSALLFESNNEKYCLLGSSAAFLLLLFSQFMGWVYFALGFMIVTFVLLVAYSISSFVRDKAFIVNPISEYAKYLNQSVERDSELVKKLCGYNPADILKTKQIFEREFERINERMSFLVGASGKVGLFPSFLAIAYAFYEFNSKDEISLFSIILVGISIGLYLGVMLLTRIAHWQKECIYLLNDAHALSLRDK